MTEPAEVLRCWFEECRPEQRFRADPTFDAAIAARFGTAAADAQAGRLAGWEAAADGALALLLLLDQFTRNIHRGRAAAFAGDALARGVANRALARGFDRAVPVERRLFCYLPFVHSEDRDDQRRAVALIATLGDAAAIASAQDHRAVIERFGRFPHRNAALGRISTPAELAWLAEHPRGF